MQKKNYEIVEHKYTYLMISGGQIFFFNFEEQQAAVKKAFLVKTVAKMRAI